MALGLHADDLILKSQGNYRELEELAETLDNCLDSCNLNLRSIRIIPDNRPQPAEITILSLPIEEQTIIFGTAMFSAIALGTLQKITGVDSNLLILKIAKQVNAEMKNISNEQITESLKNYLEKYRDDQTQPAFKVKIPTDT